jgi:hypothetical protein
MRCVAIPALQQKVKLLHTGDFTMLKLRGLSSLAAGLFLTVMCLAAPAQAHPVTYVSGKGNDQYDCFSPTTPCRSFQRAVNQTVAGGEVKALDPADYGPVTIRKPISITGVEDAGINMTNMTSAGGEAIEIEINSTGGINLSNLILDGGGKAAFGIVLTTLSAPSMTIKHCTVRNFTKLGIEIGSIGGVKFLIKDTVSTQNGTGILITGGVGTLDHVVADLNQTGVDVVGDHIINDVTAVDSIASNNALNGFVTENRGVTLRLARTTATQNGTGVNVKTGNTVISFGDKHIAGNGTDVIGTLTKIGTQ